MRLFVCHFFPSCFFFFRVYSYYIPFLFPCPLFSITPNDSDGDGLDNYYEEIYGTNPELPDTDGDGLTDYQELTETGTNPLVVDSNNDGIADGRDDYDNDSIDTITEYALGINPFCIDSDYDELTDYEELYI